MRVVWRVVGAGRVWPRTVDAVTAVPWRAAATGAGAVAGLTDGAEQAVVAGRAAGLESAGGRAAVPVQRVAVVALLGPLHDVVATGLAATAVGIVLVVEEVPVVVQP